MCEVAEYRQYAEDCRKLARVLASIGRSVTHFTVGPRAKRLAAFPQCDVSRLAHRDISLSCGAVQRAIIGAW